MVTPKQLPVLIGITEELKKKKMSIAELQRKLDMKRSTLIYYLGLLEGKGYIIKENMQKQQGKPVLLEFNKNKFEEDKRKLDRKLREEENQLLTHPLTFEILSTLKKNPNSSLKEVNDNTSNYFRKASHLSWLINKGLVVNQFKITPKGLKFLRENENRTKTSA